MTLALGVVAMLVGAPSGDPPRVELSWQGNACDESDRVRARIDELLVPGDAGPTGRARVQILPDGSADAQWIATVEIDTADTTTIRTLRGGPCSSLADAIALVVAVTVDPLGASTRVDARTQVGPDPEIDAPVGTIPQPDPEDTGPAAPDPTPEAASTETRDGGRVLRDGSRSATRPRTPARPPLSASVIAEGGGALGLLPRIGGRLGGTFALGIGSARIALTGLHAFSRRVAHPEDDGTGADVALSAARVSGGWSFRAGRFTFPLCAGIEAGAFTAAGFGLRDTTTARAAWVAVVPAAQPTLWATRWLGIGLHVEAPISILRPRFGIDDFTGQDLLRVGPVGFRFGLSIEAKFFDEIGRPRRTGRQ
jgi:hypothetical protein